MVKSLEKLTKKIFSKKHSYGFDFSPISPKLMWILFISVGAIAITGTAIAIVGVVKDSKPEPGPQGEKGERGRPGINGTCTNCNGVFDGWYKAEKDNLKGADGSSAYTQWFDTICEGGADPLVSKDNGALIKKLNGTFDGTKWNDGDPACTPNAFYNWLAMKSREQIQGGFGNDPAEPYKITVANATNSDNLKQGDGYVGSADLVVNSAERLTVVRQIGGVDFDGSQSIDLPGVNIEGNQGINTTQPITTSGNIDATTADVKTFKTDSATVGPGGITMPTGVLNASGANFSGAIGVGRGGIVSTTPSGQSCPHGQTNRVAWTCTTEADRAKYLENDWIQRYQYY